MVVCIGFDCDLYVVNGIDGFVGFWLGRCWGGMIMRCVVMVFMRMVLIFVYIVFWFDIYRGYV